MFEKQKSKRKTSRLLSALTAGVVLLSSFAFPAITASAANGETGGVLTLDSIDEASGTGWTWKDSVLTLSGVNLTRIELDIDATIVLEGSNKVKVSTTTDYPILSTADVTIKGSGTLELEGGADSGDIDVENLTVESGKISTTSSIECQNMTVNGGYIEANSTENSALWIRNDYLQTGGYVKATHTETFNSGLRADRNVTVSGGYLEVKSEYMGITCVDFYNQGGVVKTEGSVYGIRAGVATLHFDGGVTIAHGDGRAFFGPCKGSNDEKYWTSLNPLTTTPGTALTETGAEITNQNVLVAKTITTPPDTGDISLDGFYSKLTSRLSLYKGTRRTVTISGGCYFELSDVEKDTLYLSTLTVEKTAVIINNKTTGEDSVALRAVHGLNVNSGATLYCKSLGGAGISALSNESAAPISAGNLIAESGANGNAIAITNEPFTVSGGYICAIGNGTSTNVAGSAFYCQEGLTVSGGYITSYHSQATGVALTVSGEVSVSGNAGISLLGTTAFNGGTAAIPNVEVLGASLPYGTLSETTYVGNTYKVDSSTAKSLFIKYSAPKAIEVDLDGAGGDAAVKYESFEAGWNAAVGADNTANTTVKLLANWTADASTHSFGMGDGFGISSTKNTGNIRLPENKTITLDLNGKTINRGLTAATSNGMVIYTLSGSNLTIKDTATGGKITGGNTTGDGGAICSNGTLTLESGTICGNKVNGNGGGVYSKGDFTMNGGEISGNEAKSSSYGQGGGVYLSTPSLSAKTFTMNGGKITGNISNIGAFACSPYCAINVSGNANITGNIDTDSTPNAENVVLYGRTASGVRYDVSINIIGALTTGAGFGVQMESPSSDRTPDKSITGNNSADYSSYFTSDNTRFSIQNSGTGSEQTVKLVLPRSATVANATIGGTKDTAITDTDLTLTLKDVSFKSAIAAETDVSAWFTNLPAGLTAKIKTDVSQYAKTAAIKIGGTPTAISTAAMTITIPAASLVTDADLTVTANADAKWNIADAAQTFTVTYDANGGTGTTADDTDYENGATVNVKANGFTAPTGKTFKEWNTLADGTGTAYAANATFSITANTTLYAIWQDANAPSATVADVTISGTKGTRITEQTLTITLTNDTIAFGAGSGISSWFTNMPAGITAVLGADAVAGASTFSVILNDTPSVVSSEAIALTIPNNYLTVSSANLAVTANANAKWNIIDVPAGSANISKNYSSLSFDYTLGYSSIPTEVTVNNFGTAAGKITNVTLGTDKFTFTSEALPITIAENGGNTKIAVAPVNDLAAGTYTDTLTIEVEGASPLTVALTATIEAEDEDPTPSHCHNYVEKFVSPSCFKDGSIEYWCDCGDHYTTITLQQIGYHTWGDWTVTTPATVDADGVETRTCSVCGETETRVIPKLDPEEVTEEIPEETPEEQPIEEETPIEEEISEEEPATEEPLPEEEPDEYEPEPIDEPEEPAAEWESDENGAPKLALDIITDGLEIYVDGELVSPDCYIVNDDNTITFTAEFLASLAEGSHEFEAVTAAGSVATEFSVAASPANENPPTGVAIPLMGTAIAAIAALLAKKRK